ncbi:HAMP domain-containing sensor histidine kinase [Paenibacillus alvei]|uniref:histidine kinase n=1 Tax=Paenibacillus alvei TaxID=44250 RepID=A0AAP6ZZX7_PAEAL|nr:HAMP domain-containing sensor histidine kinase [Paenibacillus alvei]MBG9735673.1 histidine kinase [Paenibacillus alvei]MBG9746597.1 histidine kinase [Paenibacillus alvei]MCY9578355.1 HAMP domain-containing histidine kinase [Paenibacillus alvei]MCY9584676.1 HAMP domain-containing histidine kinase [Paenibacillus alvei]NOJ73024.1 HAMP domain-containing histidine kinase [Paenibacillus alvei]
MGKLLRSFRFKMILLLACSMLLSGIITYSLFKAMQLYYHTTRLEDPFTVVRYFMRDVGDIYFFLIIYIPLTITLFFLFTRRYSAYFREISTGIRYLADGDFTREVQITSNDEFEEIARDLNQASLKLRGALERGDFAERSKDQLILNLAHDLRTPLTSVIGYLDFILREEALSDEQRRHFTEIAFAKSKKLEKLLEELFELTRTNYGKQSISKNQIDVGELLMQLNEEMYPVYENQQLISRMSIDPHLTVLGDGDMLARVFENLLMNATRYGSDGKYIDIHARSEAGAVVIQVVNYGAYIPPEKLPHIFDMFYIGDESRTQREGSTGLGLFIAKNIVEQHHGSITAQSDVICTQFKVCLPMYIAPSHKADSNEVASK